MPQLILHQFFLILLVTYDVNSHQFGTNVPESIILYGVRGQISYGFWFSVQHPDICINTIMIICQCRVGTVAYDLDIVYGLVLISSCLVPSMWSLQHPGPSRGLKSQLILTNERPVI